MPTQSQNQIITSNPTRRPRVGAAVFGFCLLILPFLDQAAQAKPLPLPRNQCYQNSCSAPALEIWNRFEAGQPPKILADKNLYTGSCYYRANFLDGKHEHFAVLYLKKTATGFDFLGEFSFFANPNPYLGWTTETAEAKLKPSEGTLNHVTFEDTYAWADFHPGQIPIYQYFLRSSEGHLVLIGIQGVEQTAFCDLHPISAQESLSAEQ